METQKAYIIPCNGSVPAGYIYKVSLVGDSKHWIFSRENALFEPKIFSHGPVVKRWLREHLADRVEIELICYCSTVEELRRKKQAMIKADLDCLNNTKGRLKGRPFKVYDIDKYKEAMAEKGKRMSLKNEQARTALRERLARENKLKIGKNSEELSSVDELIEWTKSKHFKFMKLFKFDSSYAREKFSEIFSRHYLTMHELIDAIRSKHCTQSKVEFWLERGYSREEAKLRVFSFNVASRERGVSKAACELFAPYYMALKDTHKCWIHQKLDPLSHEYFMSYDGRLYQYDFTIEDLKIIFEYNEEHAHANPSWPKERLEKWHSAFTGMSADEYFSYYNKKIEAAESKGLEVVQIWSSEMNKSKIIEDALKEKGLEVSFQAFYNKMS